MLNLEGKVNAKKMDSTPMTRSACLLGFSLIKKEGGSKNEKFWTGCRA
jgi:hypothetical protein